MEMISGMDLLSSGVKTAAMLFLVLGLLILVLYLMRKGVLLGPRKQDSLLIKVLSSMNLSPKDRIEVIEVSGERLVLGITSGSISLLTKLTRREDANSGEGKDVAS